MSTTTRLSTFRINYLTQDQYDEALENGDISDTELYCVSSETVNIGDWVLDTESVPGHLTLKYKVQNG